MCSFCFIAEFPDDGFYRNALNLIRIRVFSSAKKIAITRVRYCNGYCFRSIDTKGYIDLTNFA